MEDYVIRLAPLATSAIANCSLARPALLIATTVTAADYAPNAVPPSISGFSALRIRGADR